MGKVLGVVMGGRAEGGGEAGTKVGGGLGAAWQPQQEHLLSSHLFPLPHLSLARSSEHVL